MVFQSYALFPHMTVFDNVAYPLRMRDRLMPEALGARVAESLRSSAYEVSKRAIRVSFPAGSSSASRWRAPLFHGRVFC